MDALAVARPAALRRESFLINLSGPGELTMSHFKPAAILAVLLTGASAANAQQLAATIVRPAAEIKWIDAGFPGVATALIDGDMSKGASYFYLRYAAGFVTPPHSHTADHRGTIVSGTLLLTVVGKEHRLAPGSYFALKDKEKHVARCESAEACVMFMHAQGPWDVVPEK